MGSLLSLRGVAKSFGRTRVLEDVNVDVQPGEIVALVGENGSGKSTTARIIAGVIQPDDGEIIVEGVPQHIGTPRRARTLGICYVSQEPALVPTMSVRDNLGLARLSWMRRGQNPSATDRVFEQVGLTCDPRQKVATLSAAQQAQIEIAKALLAQPRLLVLDEVTTRMPDPSVLLTLVEKLAKEGVGSILITHRFKEIKSLADRAVVLRDGHIVGELQGAELTDARLGEMMVGRGVSLLERRPSQSRDDIALRLDGIRLSVTASPIDLTVRTGEVVGIGGLMGSGRSRLLETIAGSRKAEAGNVLIDGVPLPAGISAARAAGLCFVPEDRNRQGLVRKHSILSNIRLNTYRAFQRPRRSLDREVAERMSTALRIRAPHVDVRVDTLSGGNAQKVVFARELSREPAVFLLDEPTRGVDVGARADIYELIRTRVQHGAAVLVASSDLQELAILCDRIVVLFEGSVVGELDGDEIDEQEIILLASGADEAVPAPAHTPPNTQRDGTKS